MDPERWKQVDGVLQAVLDRPPEERDAFLLQACAGDEALDREVRSLLASQQQAGSFLESPAIEVAARALVRQQSKDAQESADSLIGRTVSYYRVVGKLGGGGMGVVYKAEDTRLQRFVALKFLSDEFARDPEALNRFQREARAASALNHPHICQLYDVGPNYLVMEYVEGTPLKGPLPLDQTLQYAAQICDALDAAHKKNITHRDLKPANILVTKAGVKLLDFGLAKIGPVVKADEATMNTALTGKGEILGTLLYMSPEQVNGQGAGPQSDIFSFGLVLYEMLTGKRAFDGKSQASVIAAILERPAPSITDVAPASLDRVLKRCLEKDPENRWQNARDLGGALECVRAVGPAEGPPGSEVRRPKLPWAVAAVFVVLSITLSLLFWRATRPVEPTLKSLVRLDVDLGSDASVGAIGGPEMTLSPEGTRLVYVSQNRLFVRRLDQPRSTELAGTEGARAPFCSPDGHWVAFVAQGRLKKISVDGGATITVSDTNTFGGGSWGEDGSIIAALDGRALSRIPSAGGTPTPVTELAPGEGTHRWPQILPGGKAVLFTANSSGAGFDGANIEVMSLKDHRRKTLQRGGTFGRYLPTSQGTGHLIYVTRGTLFAVPFDPDRLEVHGTPVPVLEQVSYSAQVGYAQLDFSRIGMLAYRGGGGGGAVGRVTVQWLDSQGKTQPLLAKPGYYVRPRFSPDGQRLALAVTESGNPDVWLYDWQRDTTTRLTFGGGGLNPGPVWSPDGRFIVYEARGGISWTLADGASEPQPLTQSKNRQIPLSFTSDGKHLVFNEVNAGTGYDLWTVSLESDGAGLRASKPEVFLRTPSNERNPFFSPDGRWLAYASDESGIYQVYVRAFPTKGGKSQVSSSGGMYPVWSNKGSELFFRSLDNRIMVATYTAKGDLFTVNKPRLWSEKQLADIGQGPSYDVSPDGKRIAALMPAETPDEQKAQHHVIFLENFFDELRRRVPAGSKN